MRWPVRATVAQPAPKATDTTQSVVLPSLTMLLVNRGKPDLVPKEQVTCPLVVGPHSKGQVAWPWSVLAGHPWADDLAYGGGEGILRAGGLLEYEGGCRKKARHLLGREVLA
jgi:hypothetical protein